MERFGFKTFMLMLASVGVIAPAAEWINPPASVNAETAALEEAKPTRRARELRDALLASMENSIKETPRDARPHGRSQVGRSPFDLPTFTIPVGPFEEPLPVVELLGIIETPDGSVATLSIDGASVSLQAGESSGRVKLQAVKLPDGAVLSIGKRAITIRVP